jgi:hypothetical protein
MDGAGTAVTTINTGSSGYLYQSVLDGPGTTNNSSQGYFSPVGNQSIN